MWSMLTPNCKFCNYLKYRLLLNTQLQILQLYDVQDIKHPNANFEVVSAESCSRGNVAWGDSFGQI